MRKKKGIYYADFETTLPNRDNKVRVYSWAIVSGEEEYSGEELESFMSHVLTHEGLYFFHNLKFDFSYIHYYLLEHDIPYTMIERKGTFYSVKFYNVELRDSLNILNMSLREIGKNYNKKYQKTSIDYGVPYNHKCTEEELIYNINDCRVLEEGLNNFFNDLTTLLEEAGFEKTKKKLYKKLTIAGISFEAFRESSMYDKCCPKTSVSEYANWKDAYKGGYVYSAPRGIVGPVRMYDENSMYPHKYATINMPYGYPYRYTSFDDLEKYNFYIARVYIRYDLKEGYIPIIGGSIGKFGSAHYSSSSDGKYEEHTFCNIDLELIREFYDCDIKLVWGYAFNTKEAFFKKYADTFIAFKNKYHGPKRNIAKIMLNSPYGKTGMNGTSEIKKWSIDKDTGLIKSELIGFTCEDSMYQALYIAIAITASARKDLLTTAKTIGFKHVHYMDTDSIKFDAYINSGIKTDPNRLGAWKDEGTADLFKTIAPKKYVYYIHTTYSVPLSPNLTPITKINKKLILLKKYKEHGRIFYTCAGFNQKVLSEVMHNKKIVSRETAIKMMNKFDVGLQVKCNQSKLCKGGRAILNVTKEIK